MLNGGNGSEERISVPSCYGGIGAPVGRQGSVSHDSEALASVAKQLWDLERLVKAQADEMLSKDQKILALQDLVNTLQQHQAVPQRLWAALGGRAHGPGGLRG